MKGFSAFNMLMALALIMCMVSTAYSHADKGDQSLLISKLEESLDISKRAADPRKGTPKPASKSKKSPCKPPTAKHRDGSSNKGHKGKKH